MIAAYRGFRKVSEGLAGISKRSSGCQKFSGGLRMSEGFVKHIGGLREILEKLQGVLKCFRVFHGISGGFSML